MSSRLEGADADAWLCAALAASHASSANPEQFAASIAALGQALVEVPDLAAPTLAFDLSLLLSGHKLQPLAVEGPLAPALRGYEDFVLARLVSDRRWLPLQEAWLGSSPGARATSVGLLVARLMQRLQGVSGTAVSQAAVRRLAMRSPDDALAEGRHVLATRADLAARLGEAFDVLAKKSRQTRALLSDAEVFLLENVNALEGLAARVALTQLADVAQAIEERLPTRMKMAPSDGEAATALEEESAYPVGGWSSITNQGTPESLVTSELVYMDDVERPDLFDLRFVEGELLYYARDESVALRRQRTLVFVLDAALDETRIKDEGVDFQRLVVALGAVVASIRRLTQWLDHEALSFELCFVRSGNTNPLQAEAGVVSLLLKEWQERGRLVVREDESLAASLQRLSDTHARRADVVVLTPPPGPPLQGAWRRAAVLAVGERPQLIVSGRSHATEDRTDASTTLDRWAAETRALLSHLLG